MCGIIGSASDSDVVPDLLRGLRRLEYRGYDSSGISTVRDGGFQTIKQVGKVQQLVEELPPGLESRMGIAHTRWATQGGVTRTNAHPHNRGRVSLAHNGIVENFDELARETLTPETEYRSETDSELVAILIADGLERGLSADAAVLETFARIRGQNSFCLIVTGPGGPEILAISRKSLVTGRDLERGRFFISSDAWSLEPLCEETGILDPETLLVLTPEGLQVSEGPGHRRTPHRVGYRARTTGIAEETAGGTETSHMRREILAQPTIARDILERLLLPSEGKRAHDAMIRTIVEATDEITSVSCGSSYYASLLGKYWFERLGNLPFKPEIASEFVYNRRLLRERSTLLSISQSGETADTLVAIRRTKGEGYETFVTLCNTADSSITRAADHPVLIGAGREISVAATKTFTATLLHLFYLAHSARALSAGGDAEADRLLRDLLDGLRRIPDLMERTLEADDRILDVAQEIAEAPNMLFIARGILLPIAMEGALKMKEISYIHAEAYAGGELKHGSLALVDSEVPVIAIASTGSVTEKIKANLREIRARNGRVFLFCDSELLPDPEVRTVILPKTHYLLSPMVAVVALQLLAFHVANLKGIDLDRPRNLAKSVTVE